MNTCLFSSKTSLIPILYYQIEGNGENNDNIDQVAFQKGHSSVTKIHFFDEDLLLGFILHNRPLFVVGNIREQKVNRILIDDGSSINLLSLKTMKDLKVPINELLPSQLIIQGFNQNGQKAFRKIRFEFFIDDMESNALFHVIDIDSTYNMLLGRPWMHQNGVVSLTLH